jgi:hypothetical protein
MSAKASSHPSAASWIAKARPMPEAAPVTTATRAAAEEGAEEELADGG